MDVDESRITSISCPACHAVLSVGEVRADKCAACGREGFMWEWAQEEHKEPTQAGEPRVTFGVVLAKFVIAVLVCILVYAIGGVGSQMRTMQRVAKERDRLDGLITAEIQYRVNRMAYLAQQAAYEPEPRAYEVEIFGSDDVAFFGYILTKLPNGTFIKDEIKGHTPRHFSAVGVEVYAVVCKQCEKGILRVNIRRAEEARHFIGQETAAPFGTVKVRGQG